MEKPTPTVKNVMDYHEMEKYIQNKYSVNLYEKLN
jgi:hypothetical protein